MLRKLVVAGVIVFAALQAVRPGIPAKPATAEVQFPPEVKRILEKDCYSCHSDRRRLSWFDQIVPGYWLVRYDILTARRRLNFSALGAPAAAQESALYEGVNLIQFGDMPLPDFRVLHPGAKVTPDELATLKAFLAPWTSASAQPITATATNREKPDAAPALNAVQPEFDGFPFDPNFEHWKPIGFTDRGDNSTFRFLRGIGNPPRKEPGFRPLGRGGSDIHLDLEVRSPPPSRDRVLRESRGQRAAGRDCSGTGHPDPKGIRRPPGTVATDGGRRQHGRGTGA